MVDTVEKRGPGRPKIHVDWPTVIDHARAGESNKAICAALGISKSHLQGLLGDPVKRMELSVARAKSVGSVMGAVYRAACEGKSSAAQIFLRQTGRW